MADSLDKLRSDLEKRIREIEPLIAEHAQLRKALEALKGVGGSRLGQGSSTARRSPASRARAGAKGRGRPRGSGVARSRF